MNAKRRTLAPAAIMLCAGALTSCGGEGDERGARADGDAAPARAEASEPIQVSLRPRHRSGISGTAHLVAAGGDMQVTLKLSKRLPDTLLAHIHTGPCSEEPTWSNPRIWANLSDVVDGRSETTVNVVTLAELRSESASINVHDPAHNQRPLVCGDIPRAS
jgi:hypothetical protein